MRGERRVGALIVTYGRRLDYLRVVIDSCWQEGVKSILVVDNASHQQTRDYLDELASRNPMFGVINCPVNTGSSGGYTQGLRRLSDDQEIDDIWLLDDDNRPEPGALKSLFIARELVNQPGEPTPIMFAFRKYFDKESSLVSNHGYVKRADPHFWTVLMNRFRVHSDESDINYHVVRTYVGPYGGMLISRETVKILGLPDSSYYLFGDDFEYSSRAAGVGITMFTVVSAVVEDVDRSHAALPGYLSNLSDPARLYYSTRNHLYLRKSLSSSSLLYLIDLFAFIGFITIRIAMLGFSKPKLVIPLASSLWRAIVDSQVSRMGRSDAWDL